MIVCVSCSTPSIRRVSYHRRNPRVRWRRLSTLSFQSKLLIITLSSNICATNVVRPPMIWQALRTDFHCGLRTMANQHRLSVVERRILHQPLPIDGNQHCTARHVRWEIPINRSRRAIEHHRSLGLVLQDHSFVYHRQQSCKSLSKFARTLTITKVVFSGASSINQSNTLPRSSSSLSTNSATGSSSTDYQPRFASRLSTTRLPTATGPVGTHDQIAATIDPIAPLPSLGMLSGQPSSASTLASRNISSSNVPPQQFVTMTQTTTTTFCYVPASTSLAYQNSAGAGRSATVPRHWCPRWARALGIHVFVYLIFSDTNARTRRSCLIHVFETLFCTDRLFRVDLCAYAVLLASLCLFVTLRNLLSVHFCCVSFPSDQCHAQKYLLFIYLFIYLFIHSLPYFLLLRVMSCYSFLSLFSK